MEFTLFVIILIIFSGFLKGFAGFGMSLVLISVLFNEGLNPSEFMPILVPLFVILDIILFFENKKFVKLDFKENFTLHPTTLITLFLGIMLGTYLMTIMDMDILKLSFAIFVLILLFFLIEKVDLHQMKLPSEKLNGYFGGITGILTGLFTLNSIPPSLYMLYLQYPKDKYMGSLVTFLVISDLLLVAVYLFKDLFSISCFLISLQFLFIVLIGFLIGSLVRRKVSSKYFKSFIILVLAINSLKIIFDYFIF